MPHGSDEVIFIGIILGIAIFILVALLIGVYVAFAREHRRNDKLTFRSLAGTVTDFFPGTKSKEETAPSSLDLLAIQIAPQTVSQDESESLLPSPAPETAIPSVEGMVESTFKRNEIDVTSWGLPLMASIMLGLILAPLYFYVRSKALHLFGLGDWFVVMIIVTNGIVSGGVLGVRRLNASWRQIVVASLCAGAGMMLLVRFVFAPFPSGGSYYMLYAIALLLIPFLFSPPAFLLPLFDPALRQKGPAPSTWKVMTTALIAGLVIGFVNVLDAMTPNVNSQYLFGLPIFLPALLLSIGLIAALATPTSRRGAAIGGFGILLLVFMFVFRFLFLQLLFLIY